MKIDSLVKCLCLSLIANGIFLLGAVHADTAVPQVCRLTDCVSVEVVSKDADLERGLMYRKGLDPDKGMLFVFAQGGVYSFWMKNMQFDLDILWISSDGHIVYVGGGIPACKKDPCPVYNPGTSAKYVLEINSGYAAAHHWSVGDMLSLKGL